MATQNYNCNYLLWSTFIDTTISSCYHQFQSTIVNWAAVLRIHFYYHFYFYYHSSQPMIENSAADVFTTSIITTIFIFITISIHTSVLSIYCYNQVISYYLFINDLMDNGNTNKCGYINVDHLSLCLRFIFKLWSGNFNKLW